MKSFAIILSKKMKKIYYAYPNFYILELIISKLNPFSVYKYNLNTFARKIKNKVYEAY